MESGVSCHHCSPTLSTKSSPRVVLLMLQEYEKVGGWIYLQMTILHWKVNKSFNWNKEAGTWEGCQVQSRMEATLTLSQHMETPQKKTLCAVWTSISKRTSTGQDAFISLLVLVLDLLVQWILWEKIWIDPPLSRGTRMPNSRKTGLQSFNRRSMRLTSFS